MSHRKANTDQMFLQNLGKRQERANPTGFAHNLFAGPGERREEKAAYVRLVEVVRQLLGTGSVPGPLPIDPLA
jgi:hypothetical protein